MNRTWTTPVAPDAAPIPAARRALALARALPIALVTFGGLGLLLALRLAERPLFGPRRPWTPFVTQGVCRANLWLIGLPLRQRGRPAAGVGAMVANHASWLDIFVLNAAVRGVFVSKAEVAGWPGIGWLARATGTVFVRRDRREAAAQARLLAERLGQGQPLLLFPEGTSSDSLRVLPFNPTLFGAFGGGAAVQPVTVVYRAPAGAPERFYGWWGDMEFGGHLLRVLAQPRQGSVELVWHPPLAVADFPDRKALAAAAEAAVRAAHPGGTLPP